VPPPPDGLLFAEQENDHLSRPATPHQPHDSADNTRRPSPLTNVPSYQRQRHSLATRNPLEASDRMMNNLFGGFNPSKLKAGECRCSCQYSYVHTLHLVTFVTQKEGVMHGALINRRTPRGAAS
jgi:hypothetical protein